MLLLTIAILMPIASYTAATALHYNNFCGINNKSVEFSRFKTSQCVCFEAGTYQLQTHSSPCNPTPFRVEYEQCVEIPSNTKAIRRLEKAAENEMPTGLLFQSCNEGRSRRVKREEEPVMDEIDEDFSSLGVEIGQELMRTRMADYVDAVIAKLTGLHGEGGGEDGNMKVGNKYPVIRLLDYTKQIMQKTCTVVNPDFFDLALNSFINIQLETFHIREPYIGYSAFKRIEQAMMRCLQLATPHIFVTDDWENRTVPNCDNHMPTKTSDKTIINSGTPEESVVNITIPPYASAELEPGKIAEPLIETVWKMLVSAHSYCCEYFNDYYNDHHTYTVALLPLFSNEIQNVWLNEVSGTKGYDLNKTDKAKLYGGMLGDVLGVLRDVDYCVGASRAVSAYPWFMSRPLKDPSNRWNIRKKREAGTIEESDETQVVSGRVVTDENVLVHKCQNDIRVSDSCG